jgi:hypothetical protein
MSAASPRGHAESGGVTLQEIEARPRREPDLNKLEASCGDIRATRKATPQ